MIFMSQKANRRVHSSLWIVWRSPTRCRRDSLLCWWHRVSTGGAGAIIVIEISFTKGEFWFEVGWDPEVVDITLIKEARRHSTVPPMILSNIVSPEDPVIVATGDLNLPQ
uniref:Uncharacterized protein n=1 Tax=Nelumbo nucifera TaxID=4432 RepID=A0A822YBN1_NELNU|nr:TPA_asm: hypothetical protein HUJ06_030187 [Nelumbo nucifera]